MSDANKLAPTNRAVHTFAGFNVQLSAEQLLPSANLHTVMAVAAGGGRMEGTCLRADDATLSVATTAYNPSIATAAAADFLPCVARPVEAGADGNPWFEPVGYDAQGWQYRFGLDVAPPPALGNCSLRYEARRRLDTLPTRLQVVELGSTTSCAAAFCALDSKPLAAYASDRIVARITRYDFNETGGLGPASTLDDVVFDTISVTARPLAATASQLTFNGKAYVVDEGMRPSPGAVWLEDEAAPGDAAPHEQRCTMTFAGWKRWGSRWSADASMACLMTGAAPTGEVSVRRVVRLSSDPWGSSAWARAPVRTITMRGVPLWTDAPPAPRFRLMNLTSMAERVGRVITMGDTVSFQAVPAGQSDEPFWVAAVQQQGMQSAFSEGNPRLDEEPSLSACGSTRLPPPTLTTKSMLRVVPSEQELEQVTAARVAACANVSLSAVRPALAAGYWPAWHHHMPAAWFSAVGRYRSMTVDGVTWYVSDVPVWSDGDPVAACDPAAAPGAVCNTPGAYPFKAGTTSQDSEYRPAARGAVVSQWVGLASAARVMAPLFRTSDLGLSTPSAAATKPASPHTADWVHPVLITLLAVVGTFMLALGAALVATLVSGGKSRPTAPRGLARAALTLALPVMAAAVCSEGRSRACMDCRGVLSATNCICSCGFSSGEVLLYGMVGFPVVLMLLVYV